MSLWGNYDAKAASGTGTIQVVAANSTAIGSSADLSTNFAVGDYLYVGKNWYVFTAIANATIATVRSANSSTDMASAQANGDYVVSEKPLFVTFSESLNSVGSSGTAQTVYGVSADELAGTAGILSVAVTAAGSGFTSRPTVTFTDSTGSGSGATATATAGVVTISVGTALDSDAGSNYTNGDIVTVSGGTSTVAANAVVTTGASNTSVASLTLGTGGSYTALPSLTGAATTTTGSGSGLKVNLAFGANTVTVTAAGNNYATPAITWGGNTAATGTTATITQLTSHGSGITHTGWNRKTIGTGGRAGRVFYETLVAGGISGDADEDTIGLPE